VTAKGFTPQAADDPADPDPTFEELVTTSAGGRDAVIGVYLYPDETYGTVLTVVAGIDGDFGDDEFFIDANDVDIRVEDVGRELTPVSVPSEGALLEAHLAVPASYALYDFDYEGEGSPEQITVFYAFQDDPASPITVDLPSP